MAQDCSRSVLMKTLLLLGLLLLGPQTFEVPEGAILIQPPPVYAEWYQEVVECVGVERSYDALEFWVVPAAFGRGFTIYGDVEYAGYYDDRTSPWKRIYLVSYGRDDPRLVKHEMTHHLLAPIFGHPEPPFSLCEIQ